MDENNLTPLKTFEDTFARLVLLYYQLHMADDIAIAKDARNNTTILKNHPKPELRVCPSCTIVQFDRCCSNIFFDCCKSKMISCGKEFCHVNTDTLKALMCDCKYPEIHKAGSMTCSDCATSCTTVGCNRKWLQKSCQFKCCLCKHIVCREHMAHSLCQTCVHLELWEMKKKFVN